MTEAEWLTCADPFSMLAFQRDRASERKMRLFGVGCCRRLRRGKLSAEERKGIEIAESYADGGLTVDDLSYANGQLSDDIRDGPVHCFMSVGLWSYLGYGVSEVAKSVGEEVNKRRFRWLLDRNAGKTAERSELMSFAHLLRCVVGNPFRSTAIDPSWLTSTVLALSSQMYASRDFYPMPILADALQDAGCDNEDILSHCRLPGEHVRGCWVVDLLTGRK
jgi:hypothetical protein